MKATNGFGVVYTATGRRHLHEAMESARSVRACMPDIEIAISVDDPALVPGGVLDVMSVVENPTYTVFDKIVPLTTSPFENSLFLSEGV